MQSLFVLIWIVGIPLALLLLALTIKTLASIQPSQYVQENNSKKK